jgi:ABC-type proline/glycine betaine transport system permease subunit
VGADTGRRAYARALSLTQSRGFLAVVLVLAVAATARGDRLSTVLAAALAVLCAWRVRPGTGRPAGR